MIMRKRTSSSSSSSSSSPCAGAAPAPHRSIGQRSDDDFQYGAAGRFHPPLPPQTGRGSWTHFPEPATLFQPQPFPGRQASFSAGTGGVPPAGQFWYRTPKASSSRPQEVPKGRGSAKIASHFTGV